MARARSLTAVALAAAAGLICTGCGSTAPAAAAAPSPTPSSVPASPTVAATSPASGECATFAQAYNGQVSPVLKGTSATGNVYLAQLADAFTLLAGTLAGGTDAYSQTVRADALAVAAAPSSLGAIATFNTDLRQFLTACGMSPAASASS